MWLPCGNHMLHLHVDRVPCELTMARIRSAMCKFYYACRIGENERDIVYNRGLRTNSLVLKTQYEPDVLRSLQGNRTLTSLKARRNNLKSLRQPQPLMIARMLSSLCTCQVCCFSKHTIHLWLYLPRRLQMMHRLGFLHTAKPIDNSLFCSHCCLKQWSNRLFFCVACKGFEPSQA